MKRRLLAAVDEADVGRLADSLCVHTHPRPQPQTAGHELRGFKVAGCKGG